MDEKAKPLFKGGKFSTQVDLDWIDDKEWAFVSGFREAATVVSERALSQRAAGRTLFYPIAFLFRHTIELELKRLLALLDRRDEVAKHTRITHSCQGLWDELRPRLGEYVPEQWIDRSAQVDRAIRELHGRDPDGQEARYHETARGEAFRGLKAIDLANFVAVATDAVISLEGIEAHLYEVFEVKAEQQAEFEAEMRAEFEAEFRFEDEAEMRAEYEAERAAERREEKRAEREEERRAEREEERAEERRLEREAEMEDGR